MYRGVWKRLYTQSLLRPNDVGADVEERQWRLPNAHHRQELKIRDVRVVKAKKRGSLKGYLGMAQLLAESIENGQSSISSVDEAERDYKGVDS